MQQRAREAASHCPLLGSPQMHGSCWQAHRREAGTLHPWQAVSLGSARGLHVRTVLGCMRGGVAVRDLGGALLEGGVDEAQVGVVGRLGVHPRRDQVLDGDLDCLRAARRCGQGAAPCGGWSEARLASAAPGRLAAIAWRVCGERVGVQLAGQLTEADRAPLRRREAPAWTGTRLGAAGRPWTLHLQASTC